MRVRRIYAVVLLAAALAPVVWLRSPTMMERPTIGIAVTDLNARAGIAGQLAVTGAWELDAPHPKFGGFSSLVYEADGPRSGMLVMGSDRGWMLRLPLVAGEPQGQRARLFDRVGENEAGSELTDLESMARDPATGIRWSAFEGANAIERMDSGAAPGSRRATREPPAMAGWSRNAGAEAMVRLRDGRFLVLAEGGEDGDGRGAGTTHPALLFDSDPITAGPPLQFRFDSPAGFSPTGAALLPDGRVLIVVRRVRYAVPVKFDAALVVADPAEIAPGAVWGGRVIQTFKGLVFAENFEGVAFVPSPGADRHGSIYIVSDDNQSMFQRTLLVRLEWPPAAIR